MKALIFTCSSVSFSTMRFDHSAAQVQRERRSHVMTEREAVMMLTSLCCRESYWSELCWPASTDPSFLLATLISRRRPPVLPLVLKAAFSLLTSRRRLLSLLKRSLIVWKSDRKWLYSWCIPSVNIVNMSLWSQPLVSSLLYNVMLHII